MAFARWWYAMHSDKKANEASSKPGEKNTEVAEPTTTTKMESGKYMQSPKPTDSRNKQPSEERQKEPSGAKSQTSSSETTTYKLNNAEVATTQADQPPQATSLETAKLGMDEMALDSLIDTLGGSEEVPMSPVYTGPEVTEDVSSRYLEELGKREGSLPPDYVKLLKSKGDGKDGVPPKMDEQDEKPMTDYELAEALSSDFTCHAASAEGKKTSLTEKPREEGEIIQAQAASSVKTSASPKEKNTKSEEEMKDDAVEALLDTLGGPEPEPPQDLTPVVEVAETIAKEKKEEKVGERDDTILLEYRLTPELDKDGKPVFPKPEEKPQTLSELDLVDEFSKDFSCSAQPASQSKSRSMSKERNEKEQCKKLGEDDETSPPEYGLTDAKDKDRKPLLPKPEEKSRPLSENDLLEGLMEGFSCSPSPSAALLTPTGTKKMKEGVKPAGSEGTVSAATVSSVQAAAPLAYTSGGKEVDEALDLLSDSLGQREPNPDENKPVVDKVKEKAKSEHRDKLGERDDTIPPDYQKLLESGEQGEPVKPTAKGDVKHKEQKMPADDSAAIDALSGDFDTCAKAPATPKRSKGKSGKEAVTTKPAPKDKGEPKDHKTARGQSSSSKPEKQKTS